MSIILNNDYSVDSQTLANIPVYTTEETAKKSNFLDNFFKYAEKTIGLYKTVKSDAPVGQAPGYGVTLGAPVEKKVLGMPPVAGYIIIASVITLVVYGIYTKVGKAK